MQLIHDPCPLIPRVPKDNLRLGTPFYSQWMWVKEGQDLWRQESFGSGAMSGPWTDFFETIKKGSRPV